MLLYISIVYGRRFLYSNIKIYDRTIFLTYKTKIKVISVYLIYSLFIYKWLTVFGIVPSIYLIDNKNAIIQCIVAYGIQLGSRSFNTSNGLA